MNIPMQSKRGKVVDFYRLVKNIEPGRSPSIYHREYPYYWVDFPQPPAFAIYNTTFHKVTPLPHCVDCTKYGQVHYWARISSVYCPALVVLHFCEPNTIIRIKYYFYAGLHVEVHGGKSMEKVTAPDKEMFQYCLAGFIQDYISRKSPLCKSFVLKNLHL